MQNVELKVEGVSISMRDGLYLLRDLHKASGGEKSKTPSFFMLNKKTKELLEFSGSRTIRERGSDGGVWVSEEMLFAYAMWVSPEFFMKVLRTFISVAKGDLIGAAEIANTEASKHAAMKLALAFITHDRYMVGNTEKAALAIHEASNLDPVKIKKRLTSALEYDLLNCLPSKKKISKLSLIDSAIRAHLIRTGNHVDPESCLSVLSTMEEAGAVVFDSAMVSIA